MAKKITKDDLQNHINKLSMSEILSILDTYDILLLINEDKKNRIDKEDLQAIADQYYAIEAHNKKAAKKSAP